MRFLDDLTPGPITDTTELEAALTASWQEFSGGDLNGMAGYKLRGRMEDVEWHPPMLTLTIERHGGTVFGSTRAELQRWTVDIQKMTATCETGGQRQFSAMQPRLEVEPLAEEIAALIVNRQQDERLKWYEDGMVQVVIGKVLPEGSDVDRPPQAIPAGTNGTVGRERLTRGAGERVPATRRDGLKNSAHDLDWRGGLLLGSSGNEPHRLAPSAEVRLRSGNPLTAGLQRSPDSCSRSSCWHWSSSCTRELTGSTQVQDAKNTRRSLPTGRERPASGVGDRVPAVLRG